MSEREKAVGQKIVERLGKFVDELQPVPLQPGQEVWVKVLLTEVCQDDDDCWCDLPFKQFARFPLSSIHPAPQPAKKGE